MHEVAIIPAHEPPLLDVVRRLFEEYAASLSFDLGFQGFAEELASLPGVYAPPAGGLLLACDGNRTLGCVALRPLQDGAAELKRLWVRPEARGRSVGRLLVEAAVEQALAAGYACIRLDTTPEMETAQRLYESLGFVEIAPYRKNPVPGTRYLELVLRSSG